MSAASDLSNEALSNQKRNGRDIKYPIFNNRKQASEWLFSKEKVNGFASIWLNESTWAFLERLISKFSVFSLKDLIKIGGFAKGYERNLWTEFHFSL